MKKTHLCLYSVLFLLIAQMTGCVYERYNRPVYAPAYGMEARVSFFYDSLQPYGRWFQHSRYGWVWYPYDVPVNWRPYTDGHWALTDYGWTWVSSRPWGWACFHYGRWFFDSAYGWVWYPDTVWAPAWVLWRTGGDWIGWAPLPPEAAWRVNVGLTISTYDADRHVPSFGYCFARRSEFFERDLPHRIALHARNVTLIRQTNIIVNNIRIVNERVVNEFPDEERFEDEFRDRVRRFRVTETDSPGPARVQEDEVAVYRPERNRQPAAEPRPEEQRPTTEHRREIRQPVVERQEQDRDRGTESSAVHRVIPTPALKRQHDAEVHALEHEQSVRKRTLEETHKQELARPQQAAQPKEVREKQKEELKAFDEQAKRERQLLRRSHQEEVVTEGTERRPANKHFRVTD